MIFINFYDVYPCLYRLKIDNGRITKNVIQSRCPYPNAVMKIKMIIQGIKVICNAFIEATLQIEIVSKLFLNFE